MKSLGFGASETLVWILVELFSSWMTEGKWLNFSLPLFLLQLGNHNIILTGLLWLFNIIMFIKGMADIVLKSQSSSSSFVSWLIYLTVNIHSVFKRPCFILFLFMSSVQTSCPPHFSLFFFPPSIRLPFYQPFLSKINSVLRIFDDGIFQGLRISVKDRLVGKGARCVRQ